MSSQLNRRLDYDWDFQEGAPAVQESPKFQEYQETEISSNQTRLEEVLFFGQLAAFSIGTVLFAFLFLSFNFPTVLAMLLSMALAGGGTYVAKELLLDKSKN